jgi:hypothetical protein
VGLAASTNAVLKNLGALTGITLMVTVFAWMNLHRVSLREEVYLGIGPFHRAFAAAAVVAALNLLNNLLPRKLGNDSETPGRDLRH